MLGKENVCNDSYTLEQLQQHQSCNTRCIDCQTFYLENQISAIKRHFILVTKLVMKVHAVNGTSIITLFSFSFVFGMTT